MADDIVTRLRNWGRARSGSGNRCEQMHKEAADEIERLRAAGDALAIAHIDDLCDCSQSECVAIRDAHTTWQQMRNG